MNINITFRNPEQERFYWSRARNNEFDGAFANGKSYVGCERAFTHLTTFNNYAMTIYRQRYKQLRQTTMKTFFKICPEQLIYKHDENNGFTVLVNRSFIYWMHLDVYDEQDLRGLEINSALGDQTEECQESIYNVLDARIGRWDKAEVPLWLLRSLLSPEDFELSNKIEIDNPKNLKSFVERYTKWPRHKKWGHFLVPNYHDVLCNVADDEEFHWTYRYYNPDSPERKPDHFYVHREMDPSLNDDKTYQQMLLRDQEWVAKYVYGQRGKSGAIIHKLDPISIIDPDAYSKEEFDKFIELLRTRAALYRILDHGDTGVTCCLWAAVINSVHIFYREYYIQGALISHNREIIDELSYWKDDNQGNRIYEEYVNNFADPKIFKVTQQSVSGAKAGFWTVAMEYLDEEEIDAPPIAWEPADNNEYATRNRINELLAPSPRYFHPLSKVTPAPAIYFIKKSISYPHGIEQAIIQIKAQRKTLIGEDNGKKLYSEERDPKIPDHSYDCVRYKIAMHAGGKAALMRKPPRMSMEYYNQMLKRRPKMVPGSAF